MALDQKDPTWLAPVYVACWCFLILVVASGLPSDIHFPRPPQSFARWASKAQVAANLFKVKVPLTKSTHFQAGRIRPAQFSRSDEPSNLLRLPSRPGTRSSSCPAPGVQVGILGGVGAANRLNSAAAATRQTRRQKWGGSSRHTSHSTVSPTHIDHGAPDPRDAGQGGQRW